MVKDFQLACQRTRYARVPVVAAPFGLVLGGGTEVVLGCQNARAHIELYLGLVEVGVGLIPAGGGCMEMAARVAARAPEDPAFDLLPLLRGPFEAIGLAKVSTSAEEARDLGYLRPHDSTSLAEETLIADAKQLALGLARAGYRPPPPRRIRVAGRVGGRHAADGAGAPGARPPGVRARQEGGGQGWPSCCAAATCPPARWSASSTCWTWSARRSCRCAGRRRRKARIQHMLQAGKPLRN